MVNLEVRQSCIDALVSELQKQSECGNNGHPFPEIIIRPYNPSSPYVFVQCSGCKSLYFRHASLVEIQKDVDARQITITI